ncbi:hypothetical protein JCM11251_000483 [Rhodosporidiobolus azoricus]
MLFPAFLLLSLGTNLVLADSLTTDNSTTWWTSSQAPAPVQSFHSSNLAPSEFNRITYDASKASDELTLLSYRGTGVGQAAPLIMDNNGSLVWSGYEAGYTNSMDLRVQQFNGEDVLTFFQGDFFSGGYGNGSWYILSDNYTEIREVYSLNQTAQTSDFHEFVITSNNTALVESWRLTEADLTTAGGDGIGWTWDCVFQEIQLGASPAEDELLFEWSSIEGGVTPGESYFLVDGNGNNSDNAFDSCHINSVEKESTGNYLVSMRGPSTIYYIDGQSGEIIWRLSGKESNFTMGTNATFWYQHDARLVPGSDISQSTFQISLFDNAAGGGDPAEEMARAIVLELDTEKWTAELVWEGLPSFGTPAASQGSHRVQENGNHVVGWGATPYFTEYDSEENIVHDVAFGTEASVVQSYRAFKQSWAGFPLTLPSLAINGSSAYASWNGATDVASWALMGGTEEGGVTTVVQTTEKSGFETAVASGLNGTYSFYAAAALASDGTCLGVSPVYSTSSSSATSANGTCPSGSAVADLGTNGTSTASRGGSSEGGSNGVGRLTGGVALLAAIAAAIALM